jgi:hypothetical protein
VHRSRPPAPLAAHAARVSVRGANAGDPAYDSEHTT